MLQPTPPPQVLAADRGGCLICIWLTTPRAANVIAAALLGLTLPLAAGVETWSDGRALLVIWAAPAALPLLRRVLHGYDLIDWPGRLKLTGIWRELFGRPRYVAHEDDQIADVEATLPAWLKRLQQGAAV